MWAVIQDAAGVRPSGRFFCSAGVFCWGDKSKIGVVFLVKSFERKLYKKWEDGI